MYLAAAIFMLQQKTWNIFICKNDCILKGKTQIIWHNDIFHYIPDNINYFVHYVHLVVALSTASDIPGI